VAALGGVSSSETVTLLTSGATGTFVNKDAGTGIPVNVAGLALGGAQAGNYIVNQPTVSATIVPALLSLSGLTANNKVYDATTNATLNTGTMALVGVLSGDLVTLSGSSPSGTFASKDVGNNI